MKRDASSPQDYLAQVEGPQGDILARVREAIFDVAPDIEEIIEYGMLGYPGLANLGAQKHYVALYVAPAVLAEHKAGFSGASCGKSCLRLKKPEQADPEKLRALLRDVLAYRQANPSQKGC